jgi:hypothetical protein
LVDHFARASQWEIAMRTLKALISFAAILSSSSVAADPAYAATDSKIVAHGGDVYESYLGRDAGAVKPSLAETGVVTTFFSAGALDYERTWALTRAFDAPGQSVPSWRIVVDPVVARGALTSNATIVYDDFSILWPPIDPAREAFVETFLSASLDGSLDVVSFPKQFWRLSTPPTPVDKGDGDGEEKIDRHDPVPEWRWDIYPPVEPPRRGGSGTPFGPVGGPIPPEENVPGDNCDDADTLLAGSAFVVSGYTAACIDVVAWTWAWGAWGTTARAHAALPF